jgi:hypothetical protein
METFNPTNHHGMFYIHYKRRGEKVRKKVFTYNWRLWTLPELKDIMIEAGFKKAHVYWEQEDRHGNGAGVFRRQDYGDDSIAWVSYLVGEK